MAARLETRIKRDGKWHRKVVYLLSSLTLDELQAQGMLLLKRTYWVVESRLHHCLDITLREDESRVRHPNAARILGTIRRVIVSFANASVDKARKMNPKDKRTTQDFQQEFKSAHGGRERLQALIFAKSPNVLRLQG